jgi:hypothetical protein
MIGVHNPPIVKYTAVWGGALARMTGNQDKWLGIPTGHQTVNINFGSTTGGPDTVYSPSTNSDDLLGSIWTSYSTVTVAAIKIFYAEGGSTGISHRACLMRYDIDVDGDLTNGIEIGASQNKLNSDTYSHIRFFDLTINSDNTVTSSQVLIGMIYCNSDVNGALTAKCVLEYT